MKQKWLILYAVIIVSWFSSCGEERSLSENEIDLLTPPETLITNLSDIATDVEYLPLQKTDSAVIGGIRDIKIIGDRIFIDSGNDIFCFDNTGRFLFNLDKKGRGPGEYPFLEKSGINSTGDILFVLYMDDLLIYKINQDGFSYMKTLSLRPKANSGVSLPSNLMFIPGQNDILLSYYAYGDEQFRNIVINLDGDTLKTRANFYKYNSQIKGGGISYANINYLFGGNLYTKEMQSDTIFTVDESLKITPYFILNCGGQQPTPEDFEEFLNQDISVIWYSAPFEDNLTIRKIIESGRYMMYGYNYQKTAYYELYDKKSNKKFSVNPETFFVDDISGGINFEPIKSIDDRLCSWIDAFTLKEYLTSDNFVGAIAKDPKRKATLENMAGSLEETDNPILIFVTPNR